MLPTFVIGLREGLEAALIVGIIAAFLRKQDRTDLLRWVRIGVATAVGLCLMVGIALEVLSRDLPQRQQEGLETVVGTLAVGMVTYMVVWMRRHSRELKGSLEGAAAGALAAGASRAGRAMVVMAFLAVLREGFETVVFLLAAFNETGNGTAPIAGAVIGIAVAVVLGWGIYRGGVRINLSKFFRATGLVLVFVAAGLLVTALHTAHEAGWLNTGQGQTVDLTWLVRPGSVQASLLTGMFGIQDHPVVIEVIGWLAYLVPVGLYVAWPPGRSVPKVLLARTAATVGAAAGVAAIVLAVIAPAAPAMRPATSADGVTARVVSLADGRAVVRVPSIGAATDGSPATFPATVTLHRAGSTTAAGVVLDRYTLRTKRSAVASRPAALGDAAIARLNDGRLPIGLSASAHGRVPVTYTRTTSAAIQIVPRTQRIVDVHWSQRLTATLHTRIGPVPLDAPIAGSSGGLPRAVAAAAVAAASDDLARLDHRDNFVDAAWLLGVVASLLLVAGAGFVVTGRRPPRGEPAQPSLRHRMAATKVSLT